MTKHLQSSTKATYTLAFISLAAVLLHACPGPLFSGGAHWIGLLAFPMVCLLCVLTPRGTAARFTPIFWAGIALMLHFFFTHE